MVALRQMLPLLTQFYSAYLRFSDAVREGYLTLCTKIIADRIYVALMQFCRPFSTSTGCSFTPYAVGYISLMAAASKTRDSDARRPITFMSDAFVDRYATAMPNVDEGRDEPAFVTNLQCSVAASISVTNPLDATVWMWAAPKSYTFDDSGAADLIAATTSKFLSRKKFATTAASHFDAPCMSVPVVRGQLALTRWLAPFLYPLTRPHSMEIASW